MVTAPVTLGDLDNEILKNWRAANAPKVSGMTPLNAPVSAALGANWESQLKADYDAGIVRLYGTDGLPLKVKPGVNPFDLLSASSLVVGVDANGVYHVVVKPKWEGASTEEMQEFIEEQTENLEEKGGKYESGSWAGYYSGLVSRFMKQGYETDAIYAKTGSYQIFGDPDNMSGFKKGAATVANWITDLVLENIGDPIAGDWGMTFDAGEIEEYAQATEVLAGALRDYNKEDPVEFPESGVQYFYLMADAIEQFNASGRNMDFVNSQLKVLRDLGYDVTAEDLPATLRRMWVQMTELNLDKNFVPIHDMTWEGQTKAVQGMWWAPARHFVRRSFAST